MLYTGIIAALSSLDLGIKWLIDREKPENFPKPLPHTKGKILLYRNHNAGFPFGFLEQHAELVRMLPLAVISGLAGFLAAILPQKGKTVQKFGIAVILGGAVETTNHAALRCPPMIFSLPKGQDSNTAEFAVILKMDNDGDTVVYSPIPLPHLENQ